TPIHLNEPSLAPPAASVRAASAPEWPPGTFAPYVDATLWPQLSLLDASKALRMRHFRLGFVVARSAHDPAPTWGGTRSATSSFRLREINALRTLGGDVAIAFGGQAGTELASAAKSGAELATRYRSVIDAYGARVIEFDLEGTALTDHQSIQRRSEALALLRKGMAAEQRPLEVWLTLPVTPTGLTPQGLEVIRSAIGQRVAIRGINAMTMDYGDAAAPQPAGRMGSLAITAARAVRDQLRALYPANKTTMARTDLWQMIGITPMIGHNDIPSEVFELSDADQLLKFATEQHLGSLSLWSLNRDRACEPPAVTVSPSCSGIVQQPYEFARVLRAFEAL
ncbi:MAG TPA: chitinase, partial [Steroidobacteraceae bacterium]|nr:chitinase [Steroidobacteraceae bacterium]